MRFSSRFHWDLRPNRLTEALATLPVNQQEAIRLRHLEAWPLARIAGHLGRTPAATAGLIKRGMRALRQSMRGIV